MRHKIARLAIVVTLGVTTFAYGSLEKRVVVRVEGKPVAVATYGGTVRDVLARAGVRLAPKDQVVPAPHTSVRDGQTIEVRKAKRVTLLLDGAPRRVLVTGLTIQEVLHEIELRGHTADRVHPSRATRVTPGMVISYRRALVVDVIHDGKTEQVITNARTVGTVVKELGIKLGKRDRVQPGLKAAPKPDMRIRVIRIGTRRLTEDVRLPFHTLLRRDRDLDVGERKVLRTGRPGLQRIRYLARYVDGEVVSKRIVKIVTVRKPVHRVIAIGSGSASCSCKTGSQTGKATWYSQADGLTAAHRTLPFGTVVRVVNLANGKAVNVTIRDRGPYGDDRIIDLSDESFRRIASLSTGVIRVKITW